MEAITLLVFLLFSLPAVGSHCPDLTTTQQTAVITKLADQIHYHDVLYFERHKPQISDAEYDQLERQLKFLNNCFPNIPIKRYQPAAVSHKAKHHTFMGSLKKATGEVDVTAFFEEFRASGIILQPKIDGIAVELIYKNGLLTEVITRGDGKQGESIIRHIQHMPLIPRQLPQSLNLVLHGELFVRLDLIKSDVLTEYASARHLVAGQVNRKKPDPETLKAVDFFPWRWIGTPFSTETETINALHKLGFKHPHEYTHTVKTSEDAAGWRETYASRKDMIFLMDGIVIKSESTEFQKNTGININIEKPEWALAWKFPASSAVATVIDIYFSKGKTGKVTPVLILSPVSLQGRTIQRVSLGSMDNYHRKNIAVGDQVSVMLKGSATPVFGKVIWRKGERDQSEASGKK